MGLNPAWSTILAGFGIGLALASSPGPVQALLLAESVRGGIRRGFRAQAGANLTFAALMVCLALGLSVATPRGAVLRVLEVVGGLYLLWLALDAFRSTRDASAAAVERRSLPPAIRGALAVLLFPGGYIFLGAVASPLLAQGSRHGGTVSALLVAAALAVALAIGDGAVVLIGGLGLRRASDGVIQLTRRILATILALLGVWLLVSGLVAS
jgi:threonine/homoserine/homoserine lactone efflux protein